MKQTEDKSMHHHITKYYNRIGVIERIKNNIEYDLSEVRNHSVPKDTPLIGSDRYTDITINDVYLERNALKSKIVDFKNDLLAIKATRFDVARIGDLPERIMGFMKDTEAKLKEWDNVKTTDAYSDETLATFTGSINATWYGEPLKRFLENIFSEGVVTTLKQLLRYINVTYTTADHISVQYNTSYITIPKNILLAILQQLILIDANKPDRHDNREVREMKHSRINRAMYKIHVGYQFDPKTIMEILNENNIMKCYSVADVMDKSSLQMLKDPPKWVDNALIRDSNLKEMKRVENENNKKLVKAREKLKRAFLYESYGKRSDMKDVEQDRIFILNLEKYNNNEFTRLRHLDTREYDEIVNNIKTNLNIAVLP